MRPQFDPEAYRPCFPPDRQRYGIAFIGSGSVVRKWQLPQYRANGLQVIGIWDRDPKAVTATLAEHSDLRSYPSVEALLNDSNVSVVDIATTVRGRAALIGKALAAGKHVLAQKPLCVSVDELGMLRAAAAAAPDIRFAVNLNGRWAPPWRVATNLIRDGAIGDIVAVTHFHDIAMRWLPDPDRHGSPLFLLFDYMIHWLDISLVWLQARGLFRVWAHIVTREHDDSDGLTTQVGWLSLVSDMGVCVSIRAVAAARRYSGHPFVVHGTAGTLRGAVDSPVGGDYIEIDDGAVVERPTLEGNWFPQGCLGSIGELLTSVHEGREPEHGFRHASRTQELVLAACRSAEAGGQPMDVILS